MFEERVQNLEQLENALLKQQAKRESLARDYGAPGPLLFRGQGNAAWPLSTTLERYTRRQFSLDEYLSTLEKIQPVLQAYTGERWEVQRDEFKKEVRVDQPLSEQLGLLRAYPLMVHARHHGFPSPLMDSTASPYVAMYFAFANANPSYPISVYAFQESPTGEKYDRSSVQPHTFGKNSRIETLKPSVASHKRHFMQQARYTVCLRGHGQNMWFAGHDEFLQQSEPYDEIITRFVCPSDVTNQAMQRLNQMNINAYTLFGNEESLFETLAFDAIRNAANSS
ncbi:FRG domain-containing protein [Endozoicomonas sp. G2_2]|uniref:FRG domain-containing protein n=1 Tax=Endozoicomonas sp. G2_2 TaxID=2821092 RepID=UPI001ADD3149|nr:FRG domain-containing protein [Endozoicomonas sp. G2_2]MBO9470403.1 FRG domain-containing protein [Endozoicomonas sp. G2_2]